MDNDDMKWFDGQGLTQEEIDKVEVATKARWSRKWYSVVVADGTFESLPEWHKKNHFLDMLAALRAIGDVSQKPLTPGQTLWKKWQQHCATSTNLDSSEWFVREVDELHTATWRKAQDAAVLYREAIIECVREWMVNDEPLPTLMKCVQSIPLFKAT